MSRDDLAERVRTLTYQVVFVALVVGLWYVATRDADSGRLILPRPEDVLDELSTLLQSSATYTTVLTTIREVALGFGIAAAVGLVVGGIGGITTYTRTLVEPVLSLLYAVPIVLAYPVCVLVFGIGAGSKVAFGALFAMFPIAIHTLRGISQVDPEYRRVARAMGASNTQYLTSVAIRSALPTILTGVRTAFVLCYLAVVAGELLVGTAGIGRQIGDAMETFQSARGFAWIVVSIVIAATLATLLDSMTSRVSARPE